VISLDTNILFALVDQDQPLHAKAVAFAESLRNHDEVAVSEFVLLEFYNLLRNAAVMARPLGSSAAVDVCEAFRHHPHWQVVGFPPDSRLFHDAFWPRLRVKDFARRRSFDWRLALSLLGQGVTDFATVNVKDFQRFGFVRVWNPLAADSEGVRA
jgi:toxin-antitoxin system PIN domain toxin